MFLKFVQLSGLFLGPLLFLLSFFASETFDTEASGGPAIVSSMLIFASIGFVIFYMFMFVLPTTFVLSKKENRRHFNCDSTAWKSVLVANLAQSVIVAIAIVITIFTL